MSTTLIFDAETNGLRPTLVHCIAVEVYETRERFLFADHPGYMPIRDGLELLEAADAIVAHNGLSYDVPHLERLYPGFRIDRTRLIDTYVLARSMFKNLRPTDEQAGLPPELWGLHKLAAWGYRLGVLKGSYGKNADWSKFDADMASYCSQDVDVTSALHGLLLLAAEAEAEGGQHKIAA